MTDYPKIYNTQAAAYDRMVSAEDCEGHFARALADLVPPNAVAVDVGCGTGRVTRLLLAAGALRVIGVEPVQSMLDTARLRSKNQNEELWQYFPSLSCAYDVNRFAV